MDSPLSHRLRLLEERISELEHQHVEKDATIAALQTDIDFLKQNRLASYKHRTLLEAVMWGLAGIVAIGMIGYQAPNWDIDPGTAEKIIAAITFVIVGKRVEDARKA